MSGWHVNRAARILKGGGVIAYPTEAVFGLGCIPTDYSAVLRILDLKQRSIQKGLILVAADIVQLEPYIQFPNTEIRQRVVQSWPGPVTWVIPARQHVPVWISGNNKSVAVRVSNHATVRNLCHYVGALVSTSANPAHLPPARTVVKVRQYFGDSIDYILPGGTGRHIRPTEIRDALTGKVLRQGG